jgi:hypothetical protein
VTRLRLGLSAAIFWSAVCAAEPGLPAERSPEPEIVVTGRGIEALDRYVEELTEVRPGGQLARWNDPVCPRAVGLEAGQNAYLAARVASVARELRIPVERGACRPNILIVVTGEADAFARLLLQKHPRLFGSFGNSRPPAEAVKALQAPRPVRWLNASRWGNGQGAPLVDGNNWIYSASRLKSTTRENATLSLILVDATKVNGLGWRALSGYLAMVGLGRPPAGAVVPAGTATILSLFNDREENRRGPRDLTRWDRAFLRGLYASKPDASASAERREIRGRMKRALETPEEE